MIKEKKEKENVLTYLELVNLKNVSLLQYEELKRKITKVEKKNLLEEIKGVLEEFVAPTIIVGDGTRTKEEFECSWCQEKIRRL
jgi:GTPase SAR1 family protein